MAENKTQPNHGSVQKFLAGIDDPVKRNDCMELTEMMKELTGADPVMWGESIVGFGRYRYSYASGREGDWFLTGFSPRKQNLTIYIKGYLENYQGQLNDLGKFKHGKACLYIKRLEDVDFQELRALIARSIDER